MLVLRALTIIIRTRRRSGGAPQQQVTQVGSLDHCRSRRVCFYEEIIVLCLLLHNNFCYTNLQLWQSTSRTDQLVLRIHSEYIIYTFAFICTCLEKSAHNNLLRSPRHIEARLRNRGNNIELENTTRNTNIIPGESLISAASRMCAQQR